MITINKFVDFCNCYNHDFIQVAWKDNDWMAGHLESKFTTAYERSGYRGAIIDFYSELDNENRKILCDYINNL